MILAILGGAFFFFLQRVYSIKSEEVIEKLSLVPEIQNLVEEANEKCKEIDTLAKEKENLEHIVEISASKYYLNKRYNELEKRLKNTYDELIMVKGEVADLDLNIEGELTKKKIEEIEKFIGHREKGDLIIRLGNKRLAIPKDFFDIYPFGIFGLGFISISEFLKSINNILKR
jgi:predicted nuclease with TOPRIM domain